MIFTVIEPRKKESYDSCHNPILEKYFEHSLHIPNTFNFQYLLQKKKFQYNTILLATLQRFFVAQLIYNCNESQKKKKKKYRDKLPITMLHNESFSKTMAIYIFINAIL